MSTLSSVPEEREQEDIEIREKLVALLLMNSVTPMALMNTMSSV